MIPKLTPGAMAGRVTREQGDVKELVADVAGVLAMDRRWMREQLGRDGGGFLTVTVSGDSMEPTLTDGETIIVDELVDRVDASGIYVIRLGVDLLVKRVQRKIDGSLVIKSDNSAYEPEPLSAVEAKHLSVIGRMVWPRVR